MNIKEFNQLLAVKDSNLGIFLPSGHRISNHFHITEVSKTYKQFVDCGGTKRETTIAALQVWLAEDYDHRLTTNKLIKIMNAATFIDENLQLFVEYGEGNVALYPIETVYPVSDKTSNKDFLIVLGLNPTNCLAPDKCGVSCCNTKGCC